MKDAEFTSRADMASASFRRASAGPRISSLSLCCLGLADHPPDSLQFVLKKGRGVRFEERLEHNQRRAQAAYGDAGLMDSLGVASQRRGPVHQEVAERVDDDAAQADSGSEYRNRS